MAFVPGPRPLAELVARLVAPACKTRGVANAALMLDPADLFGERFARAAAVERVIWPHNGDAGATLVVRANAAAALALQHVAPQVVERANILIGWPAIARLRLTQTGRAPRPARFAARPASRPLDPALAAAVAAEIGDLAHAELKDALSRLGARVRDRGSTPGANDP